MAKSFISDRILNKLSQQDKPIHFQWGDGFVEYWISSLGDYITLSRVISTSMGDPFSANVSNALGAQYFRIQDPNLIKEYKEHHYNTKLGKILYK